MRATRRGFMAALAGLVAAPKVAAVGGGGVLDGFRVVEAARNDFTLAPAGMRAVVWLVAGGEITAGDVLTAGENGLLYRAKEGEEKKAIAMQTVEAGEWFSAELGPWR